METSLGIQPGPPGHEKFLMNQMSTFPLSGAKKACATQKELPLKICLNAISEG